MACTGYQTSMTGWEPKSNKCKLLEKNDCYTELNIHWYHFSKNILRLTTFDFDDIQKRKGCKTITVLLAVGSPRGPQSCGRHSVAHASAFYFGALTSKTSSGKKCVENDKGTKKHRKTTGKKNISALPCSRGNSGIKKIEFEEIVILVFSIWSKEFETCMFFWEGHEEMQFWESWCTLTGVTFNRSLGSGRIWRWIGKHLLHKLLKIHPKAMLFDMKIWSFLP